MVRRLALAALPAVAPAVAPVVAPVVAPAVALALAAIALVSCGESGEDPRHRVATDVERCRENLRAIYAGLREYEERFGHPPQSGGVRFLTELVHSGVWANTLANAERLTCPGSAVGERPYHALEPTERYADPDAVTELSSAYAARDVAAHPLERFPAGGSVPIAACDNLHAINHGSAFNALFADGSVVTYELEREIELGHLPPGTIHVPVGPDAPLEALRVLAPKP